MGVPLTQAVERVKNFLPEQSCLAERRGGAEAAKEIKQLSISKLGVSARDFQFLHGSVGLGFGQFASAGTHEGCPYEIISTEIPPGRNICPYSPSLWSPTCYISSGGLSCGWNDARSALGLEVRSDGPGKTADLQNRVRATGYLSQ